MSLVLFDNSNRCVDRERLRSAHWDQPTTIPQHRIFVPSNSTIVHSCLHEAGWGAETIVTNLSIAIQRQDVVEKKKLNDWPNQM